MKQVQWMMKTKIGAVYLVASEHGLRSVLLNKSQDVPMASSLNSRAPEVNVLAKTVLQLGEYLDGKRKSFDLPLDIQGTAFQKKVWGALQKIPYGKTCSYQDVAKRIRNEKAVRAVGSANAKNPLCIVVPCHRVIAADGSLGGYSGGLDVKVKLLEIEAGEHAVS